MRESWILKRIVGWRWHEFSEGRDTFSVYQRKKSGQDGHTDSQIYA